MVESFISYYYFSKIQVLTDYSIFEYQQIPTVKTKLDIEYQLKAAVFPQDDCQ